MPEKRTALRRPVMPFGRKFLGVDCAMTLTYQTYKKAPQVSLRGLSRRRGDNLAALFGAPLFGFVAGSFFCLCEEVDLLGDDLASIAVGTILVGPFGVMNAAGYHYHCALSDMLCYAFADTVEAGDPVPFGLCLAVAFAVLKAARRG